MAAVVERWKWNVRLDQALGCLEREIDRRRGDQPRGNGARDEWKTWLRARKTSSRPSCCMCVFLSVGLGVGAGVVGEVEVEFRR